MKYLLIAMIMLSGCGLEVSVDPVTVKHQIDISNLEAYYRAWCAARVPTYQVEACTQEKMVEFLDAFASAGGGV